MNQFVVIEEMPVIARIAITIHALNALSGVVPTPDMLCHVDTRFREIGPYSDPHIERGRTAFELGKYRWAISELCNAIGRLSITP